MKSLTGNFVTDSWNGILVVFPDGGLSHVVSVSLVPPRRSGTYRRRYPPRVLYRLDP